MHGAGLQPEISNSLPENTGSTPVGTAILRRISGKNHCCRMIYAGWLQQNFWRPLNITTATVESDENGTPVASSYAYMTARDWLRVGQLWLDAYHNKPVVLENTGLKRNWMRNAVEPSDADPG